MIFTLAFLWGLLASSSPSVPMAISGLRKFGPDPVFIAVVVVWPLVLVVTSLLTIVTLVTQ